MCCHGADDQAEKSHRPPKTPPLKNSKQLLNQDVCLWHLCACALRVRMGPMPLNVKTDISCGLAIQVANKGRRNYFFGFSFLLQ